MKKVLLIFLVLLFAIFAYSCSSENQEIEKDLVQTKNCDPTEECDDSGDDIYGGSDSGSILCRSGSQRHVVKKFSDIKFKCYYAGSSQPHKSFTNQSSAQYHCNVSN